MHLRPAPDGTQEEGLVEPVCFLRHIEYDEKRERDCEGSGDATKEYVVIVVGRNEQGDAKNPIDKQDDGAYEAKELEREVSVWELNSGRGHDPENAL